MGSDQGFFQSVLENLSEWRLQSLSTPSDHSIALLVAVKTEGYLDFGLHSCFFQTGYVQSNLTVIEIEMQ